MFLFLNITNDKILIIILITNHIFKTFFYKAAHQTWKITDLMVEDNSLFKSNPTEFTWNNHIAL